MDEAQIQTLKNFISGGALKTRTSSLFSTSIKEYKIILRLLEGFRSNINTQLEIFILGFWIKTIECWINLLIKDKLYSN